MPNDWITISQTEPDDCYIQHRFLFMGPFLPEDFYALWAEIIAWNPRGHCTKMLCKSGFVEDDEGVDIIAYYMMILYSNPKLREHVIRSAKYYSYGELKWFSGKHKFEMQVEDGEYFKLKGFKGVLTEEEIESKRQQIQDAQEHHEGWPKTSRELIADAEDSMSLTKDRVKKVKTERDDKISKIIHFFGREL